VVSALLETSREFLRQVQGSSLRPPTAPLVLGRVGVRAVGSPLQGGGSRTVEFSFHRAICRRDYCSLRVGWPRADGVGMAALAPVTMVPRRFLTSPC